MLVLRRGEWLGQRATAANPRGTLAGTRRPWMQGDLGALYAAETGREGAAWTSFPCSFSPGGRGRGRHLTARTNFSQLGGGAQQRPGPGKRRAQRAPNGEVCKQKRAPTLVPR